MYDAEHPLGPSSLAEERLGFRGGGGGSIGKSILDNEPPSLPLFSFFIPPASLPSYARGRSRYQKLACLGEKKVFLRQKIIMKKLCLNAHFSSFIRWRLLVIVSILLSSLLDFLDVRYAAAALCLLCVQRIIPHEFMGMFAEGRETRRKK